MATPDGIAVHDWNRVHELAIDLYHALDTDNEDRCRAELLEYLEELERKYGELPSILATRGDFTQDGATKGPLLHRAYSLAQDRGDAVNALYIAHSLADHYIDDVNDPVEGRKWLDRLENLLLAEDDDYFDGEHKKLLAKLNDLNAASENR